MDDDNKSSNSSDDSDGEGTDRKRREKLKDKALTLLATLVSQAEGMAQSPRGQKLKSKAKEGVAKLGEKAEDKNHRSGEENRDSDWYAFLKQSYEEVLIRVRFFG